MKKGYTLPITGTVEIPEELAGQQYLTEKVKPIIKDIKNLLLEEKEKLEKLVDPDWDDYAEEFKRRVLGILGECGYTLRSESTLNTFDFNYRLGKGEGMVSLEWFIFSPVQKERSIVLQRLQDIAQFEAVLEISGEYVAKSSMTEELERTFQGFLGSKKLIGFGEVENESVEMERALKGARKHIKEAGFHTLHIRFGVFDPVLIISRSFKGHYLSPSEKAGRETGANTYSAVVAFAVGAFVAIAAFVLLLKSGTM